MWTRIRKTLLAGLLVLAPITLTIYIFYILIDFVDGTLNDTVVRFFMNRMGFPETSSPFPGVGILVLIVLLLLAGTFARNYLGRKLIDLGEYIVTHIPLINRIYIAIREISEAFLSEKREVFKKAVLIEYPRKGVYSVAFFTQDTKGPVQDLLNEDVVSVFVPTTPNPTSGYLLFVPKSSVIDLEMSVEDAMKLVISGGSISIKNRGGLDHLLIGKKKKKEVPGERIH